MRSLIKGVLKLSEAQLAALQKMEGILKNKIDPLIISLQQSHKSNETILGFIGPGERQGPEARRPDRNRDDITLRDPDTIRPEGFLPPSNNQEDVLEGDNS